MCGFRLPAPRQRQLGAIVGAIAGAALTALLCAGSAESEVQRVTALNAIAREREWTALEVETTLAARALAREATSWDYSVTLAQQAARQSLMRLGVYHQSMHERRDTVKRRIASLDRLARGGMARLLFGGARPPQALWWTLLAQRQRESTPIRDRSGEKDMSASAAARPATMHAGEIADVRVLWWLSRLVAWDLREVSAFSRVHHDTRAALLQSTRELEGLAQARWVRALEIAAIDQLAASVHETRLALQDERVGSVNRSSALRKEVSPALYQLELTRSELRRALRDSGYALSRRSLVRPVPGPIVGRYGATKDAATGIVQQRHGVEMAARAGSRARACAAGKVVAVAQVPLYGWSVVIDHGEHYFSLLARLEQANVRVGENVEAGASVGTVAAKRLADGLRDTVYFEMRHGDLTLDPARFLEAFAGP